jgi:hypothetical protein
MSDSLLDSVVGGARNPVNWLARGEAHVRCADVLQEAWQQSQRALMEANLRGWLDLGHGREPWEEASESLEECLSFGPIAFMHRGLAIENYLKGILVARDPERWVKRQPRMFDWTHHLPQLSSDVGFDLDQPQTEILERLTGFIYWGGRYPTASHPKHHGEGARWSSDDLPIVADITARLKELLESEIRAASKR